MLFVSDYVLLVNDIAWKWRKLFTFAGFYKHYVAGICPQRQSPTIHQKQDIRETKIISHLHPCHLRDVCRRSATHHGRCHRLKDR